MLSEKEVVSLASRERSAVMAYPLPESLLRPRLLLGYADSAYAARIARTFRRLGWEVHLAASAAEVRCRLEVYQPSAVLLELGLRDEPAWAASARILQAHPGQRVILLAHERPEAGQELLRAAGAAALVARADGMDGLVRAVYGQNLARAV